MASTDIQDVIYAKLKQVYHEYRHTKYIPAKGAFFSPKCMQICRPMPKYAALRRETILLYLVQSEGFKDMEDYEQAQGASSSSAIKTRSSQDASGRDAEDTDEVKVKALKGKGFYSIRSLKPVEASEILSEEFVAPLEMTPSRLEELKHREGWVGMRVELWDVNEEDDTGRLIRVNYWWREENVGGEKKWLQCLHDIISIGERDGTEGQEGDVLE